MIKWLAVLAAAFGALLVFVLLSLVAGGAASQCAGGTAASAPAAASSPAASEIPANLVPIYASVASRYRLGPRGWSYLAAVNKIETDFGRTLVTSPAGAVGWMQFLPATWARYGVDADRDGRADPNSPPDAISTAARYLRASGAPADWHAALYAYNHAGWYVRRVTAQARAYRTAGSGATRQVSSSTADDATLSRPGHGLRVLLQVEGEATTYANDPGIGWTDGQDNNVPALAGANNDEPGIAIYNPATLGGWWIVRAPGGATAILQQTDIGPAPSTGAVLDVNAVAARTIFGVRAPNFPSHHGTWTASYVGRRRPAGANQPATGGPLLGGEQTSVLAAACPDSGLVGASGPQGQRIAQIAARYLGMDARREPFADFHPSMFQLSWCSWFATNVWRLAGIPIPVLPYSGDPYTWGVQHHDVFKAEHQPPKGSTPPLGSALMYGESHTSSDHINLVTRIYPDGGFDVIGGNQGPGIVSQHRACRLTTDHEVTRSSCDPRPVWGIISPPQSTSA